MKARASRAIGIGMLLLALAGCTPPAPPEPTPTSPFASEAEAFAAAEETYRAYIEAVNARRADPTAEPDPLVFLVGEALEAEYTTEQIKDEQGLSIAGPTHLAEAVGTALSVDMAAAKLEVCLDASETHILDEAENDVTPSDRRTRSRLDVELVYLGDEYAISSSQLSKESTC